MLAAWKAGDRLLLARVLVEGGDIEAGGVPHRAPHVAHRHDLAAGLVEQPRGPRADVAETLDGVGEIADLLAEALEEALRGEEQSAAGSGVPAE